MPELASVFASVCHKFSKRIITSDTLHLSSLPISFDSRPWWSGADPSDREPSLTSHPIVPSVFHPVRMFGTVLNGDFLPPFAVLAASRLQVRLPFHWILTIVTMMTPCKWLSTSAAHTQALDFAAINRGRRVWMNYRYLKRPWRKHSVISSPVSARWTLLRSRHWTLLSLSLLVLSYVLLLLVISVILLVFPHFEIHNGNLLQ